MCELGASINFMSLSVYSSLNVGPLKHNDVVLTLVNRSSVFPYSLLEDELVQVDDLMFPIDFYSLHMDEDGAPNSDL